MNEELKACEQKARDLLERMGVANAQSYSSGGLVELANLFNTHPAPNMDEMADQFRQGYESGEKSAIALPDSQKLDVEGLEKKIEEIPTILPSGKPRNPAAIKTEVFQVIRAHFKDGK